MRRALVIGLALFVAGCDCSGRLRPLIASLEVSPTGVDFGSVPIASSRQATLTLRNSGDLRLTLQDTVLEQPGAVFSRGAFPRALDAAQSVDVEVAYRPDGVRAIDDGKLIFRAEGEDTTVEVTLTGRPEGGTGGGAGGAGGGGSGGGGSGGGGGGGVGGGSGGGSGGGTGGGSGGAGGGNISFPWPFDGGYSLCSDAGETVEIPLALSDAGFKLDPRLLADSAGYVLSFVDNSSNGYVAKVARLSFTGSVTLPAKTLLAANASLNSQRQPVIAGRDGGYGATLQYLVSTSQNVYFASLDNTLTASGVTAPNGVGAGTSAYLPAFGAPVWNPADQEWATFWHEIGSGSQYGIWMGRAQPNGTFIERHPISPQNITSQFEGPVFGQGAGRGVIWNGDGFAVAYVENRSTGLSLTRLSRDGGFVSASATGNVPDIFPNTSLAFDGTQYGVSWIEWGAADGGPERVRFRRANAAGAFVGNTVEVAAFPNQPLQADLPRPMAGVVSTGDGWFLVWLEFENGGTLSQLWGVKLALDGSEVAGTRRRLTCAAQSTMLPDLVWTGTYAAVAYVRGDAGTAPYTLGLLLHRP